MTTPNPAPPPRQTEIYLGGLRGQRPRVPVGAGRLEAAAERALSAKAWAYLAGGAGSEATMRANRTAFDQWRIVPRVLRDVSTRDMRVELFGRTLPAPFVIAPIGVLELMHRDADVAVARAAATTGLPMIYSSQASKPMEACAAVMGDSPRWFQLYWSKDDEFVESLIHRAERCGCEAIVVTVDTAMLGWRTRDLDEAHLPFMRALGIAQYTSDPVFMRKLNDVLPGPMPAKTPFNLSVLRAAIDMARAVPGGTLGNLTSGRAMAAVRRFVGTFSRQTLTWSDLPFLRERTKLPILLKGILHPDDARMAVDAGVDGIVVSNHGGRQVDGSMGTMEALPGVIAAVNGRIPVILDSGIRSGADVFKALALGARAGGIGRPYVYGLSIAGDAGVKEVIANMVGEFEMTMALAGCRTIAEIDRETLVQTR
jgi:lactate 2-monooxygenase